MLKKERDKEEERLKKEIEERQKEQDAASIKDDEQGEMSPKPVQAKKNKSPHKSPKKSRSKGGRAGGSKEKRKLQSTATTFFVPDDGELEKEEKT